jgi:hypothetical protein
MAITLNDANGVPVTIAAGEGGGEKAPGATLYYVDGATLRQVGLTYRLPVAFDSIPAGSAFIGRVGIDDPLPEGEAFIGNVGVTAQYGSAAVTDTITAKDDVSTLHQGVSELVHEYPYKDAAASGNHTLALAPTGDDLGTRIVLHQLIAMSDTDVAIRLQSGAGGSSLTPAFPVSARSGFVLPYSKVGWCRTDVNALLNVNVSGTATTAFLGMITRQV